MIRRKRNRSSVSNIKFLEEGDEQIINYDHDNEASAIKEHIDITLHKILKKVQVPDNKK